VLNYACHPTTLAWDNRLISPDYPGAAREVVERATQAPCVFLQGASGDLGPKEGFVGDVETADRNGRQLGYAALAALESLPPPNTRYEYTGAVVSGATIGTWSHRPVPSERRKSLSRWELKRWTIPLRYREELPSREQAEAERERWRHDEAAALAAGDEHRARDCRAMVERGTRLLARLAALPPGESFPYKVALWRIGDAVWLAVQGEPYSLLQRSLRERFPDAAIIVAALAGEWGPSYLPAAGLYGKGVYQESIAVLAPGCLEQVIENTAREIDAVLKGFPD
jgi:hypothetical protein